MMQPTPPCPVPARWWWMWVSELLIRWELWLGAYSVGFFLFPPSYVALWDSKTPHRPTGGKVSWCLETSLPSRLPPQDGSPSLTLLSLFLSFIFCPTSFRREWAAFLGAWCLLLSFRSCFVEVAQHSNDLLMNLWGRRWLFLCHRGTSLRIEFWNKFLRIVNGIEFFLYACNFLYLHLYDSLFMHFNYFYAGHSFHYWLMWVLCQIIHL